MSKLMTSGSSKKNKQKLILKNQKVMSEKIQKLRPVNNQQLMIIESDGNKLVPIRPICDALGIAPNKQIEKIKDHPIFGSTGTLRVSVAGDEKDREMFCLPYKWVLGWLLTIDARNVKPESAEAVLKFQIECYDVLFNHFTDKSEFLEQKQTSIEIKLSEMEMLQDDFKNAKERLNICKKELNDIKNLSYDEWQSDNQQLKIDFN